MADLERVFAAIGREREARQDLESYLRNAHLRRVERDDEHEDRLRAEIEVAQADLEAAIEERRQLVAAEVASDPKYVPTDAALEVVKP